MHPLPPLENSNYALTYQGLVLKGSSPLRYATMYMGKLQLVNMSPS